MSEKDSGLKTTISAQDLLNELYIQIREYEERLQVLSRNLQVLQLQHTDIEKAVETVKSLGELEEGHEILVPIGAGVYGSFKADSSKNLTVGVGSKVYMEKDQKATSAMLEKRLKNSNEIIGKIQEEIDRVAKRHQTLSQQFNLVVERVQAATGQGVSSQSPTPGSTQ